MPSLYARRVQQGLCGSCGKEPITEGSKSLGSLCQEKARVRASRDRDKRRQSGRCIVGGCDNPPDGKGGRCRFHLDLLSRQRKETVAGWKKEGKCSGCGKRPPKKKSLCQECIDARTEVTCAHYARRRAAGLCCYGDHPPLPGQSMCDYHRKLHADYRFQAKVDAMNTYGGPVCAECGDVRAEILEIDHIDGGGTRHRQEVGNGYSFYLWLRREGYPPGYRVLCPTCNKLAYHRTRAGKSKEP